MGKPMENSKIVMVLRGITSLKVMVLRGIHHQKTERKTSQHCSEAKKRTELTTWGIETTKTGLEQTKNEGNSHRSKKTGEVPMKRVANTSWDSVMIVGIQSRKIARRGMCQLLSK